MPASKLPFTPLFLLLLTFQTTWALPLTKFEKWEQPGYFRGFNISEWNNLEEHFVTQSEFNSLKATGANLVAIQTQGTLTDSFPYLPHIYDAEGADTMFWQDVIDTMVTYARNAEIQYIIAVRTGPGRSDVGYDDVRPSTIWTNSTEQQLYGSMLKDMAQRYLPDTLFVGFDLTVEPNPLDSIMGEPVYVLDSALVANNIDINAIYTLWIDSVRTVAPELPLMVQGVHWSNPAYFSLVEKQADNKIVYKTHCYNPQEFSHAETPFSATYPGEYWSISQQDMALFNQAFLSNVAYGAVRTFQQTHDVPIMIGEFGLQYPQNGGELYLTDITDIACGYGWHFTYWNWNNTDTFNYPHFDDTYGTDYMGVVSSSLNDPCVTAIGDDNTGLINPDHPKSFQLHQNYPNPFNPSTTISFELPTNAGVRNPDAAGSKQQVNLVIYDLRGRRVKTLVDSKLEPGRHQIVWGGKNDAGMRVPSGIYIFTMRSGEKAYSRKMVVLK